jgi:hypothetical protein
MPANSKLFIQSYTTPHISLPIIRLDGLDNESQRKLEAMHQWDKNTAEVVSWLRKNQGRFKRPVIEPAALSVSVTDSRFVPAVEAGFNNAQLKVKNNYVDFPRSASNAYESVNKDLRIPVRRRL